MHYDVYICFMCSRVTTKQLPQKQVQFFHRILRQVNIHQFLPRQLYSEKVLIDVEKVVSFPSKSEHFSRFSLLQQLSDAQERLFVAASDLTAVGVDQLLSGSPVRVVPVSAATVFLLPGFLAFADARFLHVLLIHGGLRDGHVPQVHVDGFSNYVRRGVACRWNVLREDPDEVID